MIPHALANAIPKVGRKSYGLASAIWVDITNLPHALFFENFIKAHDAFVTTRDFGILTDVLDSKKIDYTVVGRHGGKSAKEKLAQSSLRAAKLTKLLSQKKIMVGVSKHSVELPRVCFGLGIPCIQVVDNEYAEHQNRLTLPLCDKIITPWATDVGRLISQGADRKKIIRFRGVCELQHVKNYKPSRPEKTGYIVVRPEPVFAAYFESSVKTQNIISALHKLGKEIIVIPRGNERYSGTVSMRGADSLDLIYHADAFIGGGGTMNREAALLGTPTISYYPGSLLGVDRFLIRRGLMRHAADEAEILKLAKEPINRGPLRAKAKNFVKKLEDPFKHIEKELSNLAGRPS